MKPSTVRNLSIAFFIAMLLVGGFTFLAYLGVPYHAYNLVNDTGFEMINRVCGEAKGFASDLCRGTSAFFPFLIRTFSRMKPFLGYGILSVLFYGAYYVWRRMTTGHNALVISWKPWKALVLVIGLLWLMFTVLTWGGSRNETSVRFLVEPRADTYNVGEQALAELQSDFQGFQNRGCLEEIGTTNSGAKAYLFKRSCIQASFFSRVLSQVIFVLVLLIEFLVLGRGLLRFLRLRKPLSPLLEFTVSAALGACGWIVLLWSFAVAGIYVSTVGWVLAVALPVLFYRQVLYWVDRFLHAEWTSEHRTFDLQPLIVWLLISYALFGFLSVVRPFPIGWDDLGSYLNRPHLLVSYGKFIFSMSAFEWTYLTSLGYLLFGYGSTFGATASMMVNWMAGFLALLTVFTFVRNFLGARSGYLATLLYCILPLVGHFSFADMKIDNAVFFLGSLGILLTFVALLSHHGHETAPEHDAKPSRITDREKLLFLAGLFAGFAFATKITSIMVILTMIVTILGLSLHWSAFVGGIGLVVLVLSSQQAFAISKIWNRVYGVDPSSAVSTVFHVLMGLLLLGGIGYAVRRHRSAVKVTMFSLLACVLGVGVAIAPWIEHNTLLAGGVIPGLRLGAPNNITPNFSYRSGPGVGENPAPNEHVLPVELRVDPASPACTPTGGTEELDRYWGFGDGWGHYLLLPWRTVMNLDSTGYYVTTMAALLLFPLVLLLPYLWTPAGRWLRWLAAGTALLVVQWVFLANGIPWYGIGMFLGLVIVLEALVARAPDVLGKSVAGIVIGLSVLTSFGFRLGQYEQQKSMYEYPMGKISGSALQEITVANYDDIVNTVMERRRTMPDRPYLYRIGTFISYFIPQNLEVIGISDHQLDVFNCLFAERDPALTTKRLQALGFNSFVLDLNTATIEADPQGSLHKKVALFQEYVNNPLSGAQIALNDGKNIAYILLP